jgi:hypothetical protein
MSLEALGRAASWWRTGANASLQCLGFHLADCTNSETGLCCPSISYLVARTHLDESNVRRKLKEAEELRLITREFRFVEGRQTSTQYEVLTGGEGRTDPPRPGTTAPLEGRATAGGEGRASAPQNQEEGTRNRNLKITRPSRVGSAIADGDCTPPPADEPKTKTGKRAADDTPKPRPCPYKEIRNIWIKYCPMLPRPLHVEDWTAARKATIRARWQDELPDLECWAEMAKDVAKSKFLTGKCTPAPGRQPFKADLFWICKPENLSKLAEGNYQ